MQMDGELKKYLDGLRGVDLTSKSSSILSTLDNVANSVKSLESNVSASMWSELGKEELTNNTIPYLLSSTNGVRSSVQLLDDVCSKCVTLRDELIELESLIKEYNDLKLEDFPTGQSDANGNPIYDQTKYEAAKKALEGKINAKTSSCKSLVSSIKSINVPDVNISVNGAAATSSGTTRQLSGNFTNYLFVGDSRVVGMSSGNTNPNCTFVAEVGQGLNWLKTKSNIESQIQNVSKNATGDTAVVFWMGVNDCSFVSGQSYANYFNELQKKYPDVQICVASVGAVDDNLSTNVKNSDIVRFNNELEDNLVQTIKWVDVYDYTVSANCANSGDPYGVHYTNASYEQIVQLMKEQVSS